MNALISLTDLVVAVTGWEGPSGREELVQQSVQEREEGGELPYPPIPLHRPITLIYDLNRRLPNQDVTAPPTSRSNLRRLNLNRRRKQWREKRR